MGISVGQKILRLPLKFERFVFLYRVVCLRRSPIVYYRPLCVIKSFTKAKVKPTASQAIFQGNVIDGPLNIVELV